jgi:RNA polymerase sigma-70 factor, ECF subfamily
MSGMCAVVCYDSPLIRGGPGCGYRARPRGRRRKPNCVSILQRIAAGEQGAVKECLDRYSGLVWSLARRFLGSSSEAEDAVQEIFVDIWKSAARFDERTAAEATFVAMIARRRLIDRRRKAATASRVFEAETQVLETGSVMTTDLSRGLKASEDVAAAEAAIAQLPTEQQRVLRLGLVQGLTHEEIARATQLQLGTVKTNMRRGLARVRDRMRERSEVMP